MPKNSTLRLLSITTLLMLANIIGCEREHIAIPPCLTEEEADNYVALTKRQNEITKRMNAGENSLEILQEADDITPKIGYLINASNVRNTSAGCRSFGF